MSNTYSKAPRLYTSCDLYPSSTISLTPEQSHYLLTVMRKNNGDVVRVFNGRDGEYGGEIVCHSKKSASLTNLKKIKEQPTQDYSIHLYFAPIKKDRLSIMLEKSVELGVTDFHPVFSDRTENRKLNVEKIEIKIVEAAEQCERMNVPIFHPSAPLQTCSFVPHTYAAIERNNLPVFKVEKNNSAVGIIIGPEGGWTENEIVFLKSHPSVTPTSLGTNILRAETAAFFMLSRIA